jgi:prolyl-tRNA editing enzyme YbaK/EbsC (Cys-tRNA(Pro) deacylase)
VSVWPDPVERVSIVLREAGVESTVEEFADGTPTAEEAAKAAGCTIGQIVKSLVFAGDGEFAMVLVPGDMRADRDRIATECGWQKARMATADEVLDVSGFEPGGVAPFPRGAVEHVLMEPSFMRYEVVWAGAGTHSHMVMLSPLDLERLAEARAASISDPG